jgi:hypothetical protein
MNGCTASGNRSAAARVEAAEQPQGLGHGELVGELRVLQLNAEPLAQRAGVGRPREPEDLDLPFIRGGQPLADFNGGRLAGAVGSQQAETDAARHIQIDARRRP